MTLFRMRSFFAGGLTRDIDKRLEKLSALKKSIENHTDEILAALSEDLGKASFEAYAFEIAPVLHEIELLEKNLKKWIGPEKVKSPLLFFRGKTKVIHDPYGVVLIIAPWNYPFHLLMMPLIGAVASGNVVVAKPSHYSTATTKVLEKIIAEVFPSEWVKVSREVDLSEKYSYIFFTGGYVTGKMVAAAAAKYCTPVTLELGGKNPCIVDESTDLLVAAKRIAWAKCANAGQTCVAPDYLLVHESVCEKLVEKIVSAVHEMYGENPATSSDYAKIITDTEYDRLKSYCVPDKILYQCGAHNPEERKLAPTLISADWYDSVMQEEIFGPVLPVFSWKSKEQLSGFILRTPLAIYIFSENKELCEEIIANHPSGAVGINDCMLQVANQHAPFGGVGTSGMGEYHGKYSIATFSRVRTIVRRKLSPEMNLRYPPYDERKFELVRKFRRRIF